MKAATCTLCVGIPTDKCWRGPNISWAIAQTISDAKEAAESLKEESIGPSAQLGLSQE